MVQIFVFKAGANPNPQVFGDMMGEPWQPACHLAGFTATIRAVGNEASQSLGDRSGDGSSK